MADDAAVLEKILKASGFDPESLCKDAWERVCPAHMFRAFDCWLKSDAGDPQVLEKMHELAAFARENCSSLWLVQRSAEDVLEVHGRSWWCWMLEVHPSSLSPSFSRHVRVPMNEMVMMWSKHDYAPSEASLVEELVEQLQNATHKLLNGNLSYELALSLKRLPTMRELYDLSSRFDLFEKGSSTRKIQILKPGQSLEQRALELDLDGQST